MRPFAASILALSFLFAAPAPATAGGGLRPSARKVSAIKIKRSAKPFVLKLASLANLPPPDRPEDQKPDPLTPEQLTVDIITLDTLHLYTPQIGITATGIVAARPTAAYRGMFFGGQGGIEAWVQVAWLGTHMLQVQCTGAGMPALKISYGRLTGGKGNADGIGTIEFAKPADASFTIAIVGENHAPADYLAITMTNAHPPDGIGGMWMLEQCTFTRI